MQNIIKFDINRFQDINIRTFIEHEGIIFEVLSYQTGKTFFGDVFSLRLKEINYPFSFWTTYKPIDDFDIFMVENKKEEKQEKPIVNPEIQFVLDETYKVKDLGFIVNDNGDEKFVSLTIKGKVYSKDKFLNVVPAEIYKKFPLGSVYLKDGYIYKVDAFELGKPFATKRINLETMTVETKKYLLTFLLSDKKYVSL